MINALAGVLLGPLDAVLVALFIGIFRISLGLGTIYAIPGGLPGGFVVGLINMVLRRYLGKGRSAKISVWGEPIGTVLIGATLSVFIVAPWIGDVKMMSVLSGDVFLGLLALYGGWAVSSLMGVVAAFIIVVFLDGVGIVRMLE
jgi:energy coupling factor transporter S component ThiW